MTSGDVNLNLQNPLSTSHEATICKAKVGLQACTLLVDTIINIHIPKCGQFHGF